MRGLLIDAVRSIDWLVMPAEYLAQARWRREHRSKPWSEVPPALRASLLTQAETDLIAARGLDHRHDWHPRRARVRQGPRGGPADHPGLGRRGRGDLDQRHRGPRRPRPRLQRPRLRPARRDLATMALSPGARDVAVLEHAAWADSAHTTRGDPMTRPRRRRSTNLAVRRERILTGMLVAACLVLARPLGAHAGQPDPAWSQRAHPGF